MRRICLAIALGAAAFAGCAAPAAAAPSVSITVNKAKALVGEAVRVNWASSGATECSASGAWSGALAASGTQTLRFATMGVKSLTITCMTTGAPVAARASLRVYEVRSFTHSVDPLRTPYPDGYRVPSRRAAEVFLDKCTVAPATVTTPRGWSGRFAQPVPTGAPLPTAIRRGMGLKDVWEPGNPIYDPACIGKAATTARAEFTRTATRLKALGVDFINIIPWTFIGTKPDGSWKILLPVSEVKSSTMSDEDFAWAVGEAHRIGLKVTWISQIQGIQRSNGVGEGLPATRENVSRFMTAYEPYLVARAAFMQRLGVDTMSVSCSCFTVLEQAQFADIYTPAMARILPKVRAAYKGRLRMGLHPSIMHEPAIHDAIDEVALGLWWNFTAEQVPTLTVASMKKHFSDVIQGYAGVPDYKGFDKPIAFLVGAPSRADFYTTGYLEETFCSAGFDSIAGVDSACIQRNQRTDFSLQAQHIEAYLEAIREQTSFTVRSVEVADYWLTDNLAPGATFPNLAFSVRNKPAEGVIRAWFKR